MPEDEIFNDGAKGADNPDDMMDYATERLPVRDDDFDIGGDAGLVNASSTDGDAGVLEPVGETVEAFPAVEEAEEPAEAKEEVSETKEAPAETKKERKRPSMGLLIGCVVAALVVGLLIGTFVLGGLGGSAVTGKTAITESELNSPVASYSSGGKSGTISAKEVIEQTSSLEAVKDEEGRYAVPSADSILSVARNKIVVADAEGRGITATDEEVASYAEAQLGTSDYDSIAASYGMERDSVIALLHESCLMSKLRDEVLGEQAAAGNMPSAPNEPEAATEVDSETGEERAVDTAQVATKEYADYIIALAGDEWDAAAGTWASQDGPYAKALAGYQITPESATYEAATTAYYVAYQAYSDASSSVSAVWSDYVNELLSKSKISIYTMLT